MPEKRNIYFLETLILKISGSWTPYDENDALYKRILYMIWKLYVISQCMFWEACVLMLFIYDSKELDMYEISMSMAYLMQQFLGNAKMLIVIYRRKDFDWMVEETEKPPFYREHDEEFKKNLRLSVARSTKYTRLLWFFVFCTLNMAATDAITLTIQNYFSMKDNCNKKLNIYEHRFDYSNRTMPTILGNPEIYERVAAIEDYVQSNGIFEVDTTIICKAPLKVMTFAVHTPYDYHKHYAISFILQWTTYWLYAAFIIPLDLLIMCIMIQLKFQFSYVVKDLISIREDCKKIVNERLGRTEVQTYEEIDEKVLVEEIKKRYKEIILHHEHIFKYYFTAEEVCTWLLFAQYFGTSVMMCVVMYQLAFSEVMSFKFLHISFYFAVVVFQLYINCYYGNDLMIESELVATAAFQSGWEKSGSYSYKLKPYILTIMCRCLRPTQFSAGKFAYISLSTFMAIGKTSYSYFTVMTNTKE